MIILSKNVQGYLGPLGGRLSDTCQRTIRHEGRIITAQLAPNFGMSYVKREVQTVIPVRRSGRRFGELTYTSEAQIMISNLSGKAEVTICTDLADPTRREDLRNPEKYIRPFFHDQRRRSRNGTRPGGRSRNCRLARRRD